MTFAGSSILTEIIPIPSVFILAIYDFREWFSLVLLRNEAEATVRCLFFFAPFSSEAQPGGKHRTTLWLHVVSTSFSMSHVESMLGIDDMRNSNLNVLSGLNLK